MKLKYCGLQSVADVKAAIETGADAVGAILAASKRQVSMQQLRAMADYAALHEVQTVAVCRGHTEQEFQAIVQALPEGVWVQLHDYDDVTASVEILQQYQRKYICVCPVGQTEEYYAQRLEQAAGYEWILYDAPQGGGTGAAWDDSLIHKLPHITSSFIAGGINTHNLEHKLNYYAQHKVVPLGLDLSSGLEETLSSPESSMQNMKSAKSVRLMREIAEKVRKLEG